MDIDESVSGFEVRGDWATIVELGERITQALREAGVDSDALAEWEEWRPKATDRFDEEMSAKTADEASVGEGAGERADVAADEDVRAAGDKLTASYEKAVDEDVGGAAADVRDSIGHATRAVDTAGRRALRTVEESVYENVMTQISPYYFDNELISANLRRDDGVFGFEVNVNDDDLKAAVSDLLDEYDEDVDRWHLDVDVDTTSIEATHDVELAG